MPYAGHDQVWKELIPEFPADFLTLTLPVVATRTDLAGVRFQPEEHYLDSPQGRQQRLDLVAKTVDRATGAEVAVLHAEVELEFRSGLPRRWWRYNRVLALRHDLPVHTVVVYLNGGPAGLEQSVYDETSLGREVATFNYVSLGLSGASPAELLDRPEPLAWALAALTRPRPRSQRAELRLACLDRIAAAPDLDPRRRLMLVNCVVTYIESNQESAQEFEALLAEHGNQEVRDMIMTWVEKVEARGEARGVARGEARGEARGYARGLEEGLDEMRHSVQRWVKRRFGAVPRKVSQRISEISSHRKLFQLAERVQEVESLDDLDLD